MATKTTKDEPLNHGTFTNPDTNDRRVASTPEEAVRLAFDGWKKTADATAPAPEVAQ